MTYFYKKEIIETEIVKNIICNICGLSCRDEDDMNYECATIDVTWGYGSSKDMEHEIAHICEKCYDKHITPLFKIPTIATENNQEDCECDTNTETNFFVSVEENVVKRTREAGLKHLDNTTENNEKERTS